MNARNPEIADGRYAASLLSRFPTMEPSRYSQRRLWGAMIGSTFAAAFVLYAILISGSERTASTPAVMAWPAAMPGVAPPPPQTTTGLKPDPLGTSVAGTAPAAQAQ